MTWTRRWAAALLCAAAVGGGSAAGAEPAGGWRAARWGMSLAQVVAAFPGEVARLPSPERLADGNVVAAGIERHVVGATAFRVRFVFDAEGKLVLVSLRTDPKVYASPEVYEAARKGLGAELGPPAEEGRDDNFIDLRQATWRGAQGRVEVKYVPGTVVVLVAAPSQRPAGADTTH